MFHRNDTFVPVKRIKAADRLVKLQTLSQATLGMGDLKTAVKLPDGENINEWLSLNCVEFFNDISDLAVHIMQFCTSETCPEMSAGPAYKYQWQDQTTFKKPTPMPACNYISNVFQWASGIINDESIFPSDPAVHFPKEFKGIVAHIFQRFFRIYAHLFYHHRDKIRELNLEARINSSFRHFYYFIHEFDLIPNNQLAPLQKIIENIE